MPGSFFQTRVFEVIYHGQTGAHLDDKVYLYGSHEAATIRLIRDLLKKQKMRGIRPVYIDIGTNTGLHLITAAPLSDKAIGFEPYDMIRKRADNNVKQNKLANCKIYPFGLSDQEEKLPYTAPDRDNHGNGFFSDPSQEYSQKDQSKLFLQVKRGDDVFCETNIGPSVIKIDVEGFEKFVFRGLAQTIKKHKPAIIFEYNQETRRHDPNALEDIKNSLGPQYALYGIKRSRETPKLVPFQEKHKYENVLALPEADLENLI